MSCKMWLGSIGVGMLSVVLAGCGGGQGGSGGDGSGISVEGSDTMVNLAQAWAEEYESRRPEVKVEVQGGGSGIGIASLIDGVCDMANASREMKAEEKELVKENHEGKEALMHVVGYDALAIYVQKDNPLDSISIEQLAEIYGDGATITTWSQLGVSDDSPLAGKEIAAVGRQNSSGTYAYFREAVLGKNREFRAGVAKMSGSKDVVANITKTPGAIGYSGMGYVTDGVKMLAISPKKGEPAVAPTLENAMNATYPITRPLMIYTIGEPEGEVKAYLDWILSEDGQKIVVDKGYVPLGDK
ncbi:MAG TPA: phosphate ABC transporter substrate-binding protein [Thermoguttaceae bacterium]|nr:phosphate ABC transporter substrate-binding protein [Thermoguttaceae bacterium]